LERGIVRWAAAIVAQLRPEPVREPYGAWTTDRHRALALRWREAAEAHAARMRDRCPRNAELINVEEIAADD